MTVHINQIIRVVKTVNINEVVKHLHDNYSSIKFTLEALFYNTH